MDTYVILLRGVNVGGKNLLSMKELMAALEGAGFEGVRTYVQSGNIVLISARNPGNEVAARIQSNFGFTPDVLVFTVKEFNLSVANNPYKKFEGKFVHFYFCKRSPKLNTPKLKELAQETESYELVGNVFYLHAPKGIGRSKLVSNIDACLGVAATGRNLNTVSKLAEMVQNA